MANVKNLGMQGGITSLQGKAASDTSDINGDTLSTGTEDSNTQAVDALVQGLAGLTGLDPEQIKTALTDLLTGDQSLDQEAQGQVQQGSGILQGLLQALQAIGQQIAQVMGGGGSQGGCNQGSQGGCNGGSCNSGQQANANQGGYGSNGCDGQLAQDDQNGNNNELLEGLQGEQEEIQEKIKEVLGNVASDISGKAKNQTSPFKNKEGFGSQKNLLANNPNDETNKRLMQEQQTTANA